MKRPFVYIMILFSLGICLGYKLEYSITYLVISLAFLCIDIIILFYIKRANNIALFIIVLVLGQLLTINKISESKLVKFKDKYIEIEGVIKEQLDESRYILTTVNLKEGKKTYTISERILLKIKDKMILGIGDRIRLEGIIKEPKENTNPKLFNYKLYLQTKNIHTAINTEKYNIYVISSNNLTVKEKIVLKVKKNISTSLDRYLNEDNSLIIKSIILGDDSFLDEETLTKFRNLGIAHILAASGLHIGIIAVFLNFILHRIKLRREISVFITVVFLWSYGLLIGYPPSILRALIMFTSLMVSNLSFRRYDGINILFFSGFLILIINPLWLFNVGFHLSFMSTFSLIFFTRRVTEVLFNGYKRLGKFFSPLIAVQIGILPIMAYYFNNISIVALLANMILLPILSLSVVIGFCIIMFSLVSVNLSVFVGTILNLLLNINSFILEIIYRFPLTNVTVCSPTLTEMLFYYVIIFIILKIIKINKIHYRVGKTVCVYLLLLVFALVIVTELKSEVRIEYIDVGQGDCALISVNNRINFLVDSGGAITGTFDVGDSILEPYLLKNGINRINGVFISHFHNDHCKGLLSIIDKVRIDNIFIGHTAVENQLYMELLDMAYKNNIPVIKINKGNCIKISNNVYFDILWPDYNLNESYSENNLSTVMMLNAYGKKILFTGDIEEIVEERIIEQHKKTRIDIIKVPHHGSITSSTEDFINHFKSNYCVISVGSNNFGHPSQHVIERYLNNNIKLFRTDINGLVTAIIKPNGIHIYPFIKDKPEISDIILEYRIELLVLPVYLGISLLLIKIYNLIYISDSLLTKSQVGCLNEEL